MSPSRLQGSLSLLLLSCCLHAAARRDKGVAGNVAKPASGPTGSSSGRFMSPEQHACSWQLLLPTPGAAAGSELALRCQGPDGARHQCAYRGEPERCAAYGARRSHYWKQVLGGLRKKRRPCQDPAPLQPRLCAGKKGLGAELRLVPGASLPAGPTATGFPREPRLRARSRGTPRQSAPDPGAAVAPSPNSPPKEKSSERKTRAGKRKAASGPLEERPMGTGPGSDGLDQNAELTETYCAEKWHSLCNFFVNFWNG
ncbi:Fibroblast growth factor-binding protein 3 [Sciurus carolinensis]|uniref:Fibroblast growth factor-binding protein 3 n=1 Tax=Sciurus carolinensis TaxID=30640 RepID=A0AA41MQ55_SCICA|nr:fibroblast growth factor-binding protein 3 [Sciurus carolinensis]MBZ3876108.1 Fibroblast growth factor-binding protein 3 [Sciurus carolinensis]MBZ3876118.1 Fibroblast growth factor-binding protein 3 [Sciurus carolinensis]